MDRRTRMVKTLGCLVVAMTGTSALLARLDPSLPPAQSTLSFDEIIQLAQSVVTDDVVLQPDHWREIHIATDAPATGGVPLSATNDSQDWHFRVALNGRPMRASTWCDQRADLASPHVVRIKISAPHDGGAMTTVQWFCVRALVASINRAAAPGGETLPVYFEEPQNQVPIDRAPPLLNAQVLFGEQ